jgi:hypothetical protein
MQRRLVEDDSGLGAAPSAEVPWFAHETDRRLGEEAAAVTPNMRATTEQRMHEQEATPATQHTINLEQVHLQGAHAHRRTMEVIQGDTMVSFTLLQNDTVAENRDEDVVRYFYSSITLHFTGLGMACVDQKEHLVTEVLAQAIQRPTSAVTIVNVTEGSNDGGEFVNVEYQVKSHSTTSHKGIRSLGEYIQPTQPGGAAAAAPLALPALTKYCEVEKWEESRRLQVNNSAAGTTSAVPSNAPMGCLSAPTKPFMSAVQRAAVHLLAPFFWDGSVQIDAFFPTDRSQAGTAEAGRSRWECPLDKQAAFTAPSFSGDTTDYDMSNASAWQGHKGCSCQLGARSNFYTHIRLSEEKQAEMALNNYKLRYASPLNLAFWDWRYPVDDLNAFLKTEQWRSLGRYQEGMVYMTRIDSSDLNKAFIGSYRTVAEAANAQGLDHGHKETTSPKQEGTYELRTTESWYPNEQTFSFDQVGPATCEAPWWYGQYYYAAPYCDSEWNWQVSGEYEWKEIEPYDTVTLTTGANETHTIYMYDSFGDGWSNSVVELYDLLDGSAAASLGSTMVSGTGGGEGNTEEFVLPDPSTMPNIDRINGSVYKQQVVVPGTCANVGVFSNTMIWGVNVFNADGSNMEKPFTCGSIDDGDDAECGFSDLSWSFGSQPTADQWRPTCVGPPTTITYQCNEGNLVCGSCTREEEETLRLELPVRDCAVGCTNAMLGNGHCDAACFVAHCDFDFADCTLPLLSSTLLESFVLNNYHKGAGYIGEEKGDESSSESKSGASTTGAASTSTSGTTSTTASTTTASTTTGSTSQDSPANSSATTAAPTLGLNQSDQSARRLVAASRPRGGSKSGASASSSSSGISAVGGGDTDSNERLLNILPFVDSTLPRFRFRLLGMKNTIVGGVLFTLKRTTSEQCSAGRFDSLQLQCSQSKKDDTSYGADGAFMEASALYNPLLLARLGDYYLNPAHISYDTPDMINPVTKMPYGFEYKQAPESYGGDASSGYHVFFDVNFSEEKTKRLLQYMIDGFYIDQAASELTVKCIAYNGENKVFTMAMFTFTFSPNGPLKIDPFFTTFALPDYSGTTGGFRMLCECGIVILVILNLLGELEEMKQVGFHHYITNFWNAFDLANCSIMLILAVNWVAFYHNQAAPFSPRPRYYVYHDLEAFAHPLALNYTADGEAAEFHGMLKMFFDAENISLFFTGTVCY